MTDFEKYLDGLVVEHENKEVALSDYLEVQDYDLSAFGEDYQESELF